MTESEVRYNTVERAWEVRVLVGSKLYGRLFHYKKDAEGYAEELKDPLVLHNRLGDPSGLRFLKEVI
jgi:hypothetical protein